VHIQEFRINYNLNKKQNLKGKDHFDVNKWLFVDDVNNKSIHSQQILKIQIFQIIFENLKIVNNQNHSKDHNKNLVYNIKRIK
jgi:hypothetical protein